MDPPPIEIDEFLTWLRLERGRAASTVEAYRRDLRAWHAFLTDVGRPLLEVTEDDIVGWVHELRSGGLAPSTAKRRIVAVRSLHRYLAEEGIVDVDPGRSLLKELVR